MGKISGLKSKMAAGRIDPGTYQMTKTRWEMRESKRGDQQIFFCQTLVDLDNNSHDLALFAMQTTAYGKDEQIVEVNKKGQLVTIGSAGDVRFSKKMGAGIYLASLDDAGMSGKALDDVDINPGGLDGQWVQIDTPPSGKVDEKTGQAYTNIVVTQLVDGPDVEGSGGGGGGKAAGKKAASSTTATAAGKRGKAVKEEEEEEEEDDEDDEEEEDGEEEEEEENELEASEEEIEATKGYIAMLVADPASYVKNFDEDANGGGVTLKQATINAFTAYKGQKSLKGKVSSLAGNPLFHTLHAEDGGWVFDEEEGVLHAAPAPAPKKGGKSGGKK